MSKFSGRFSSAALAAVLVVSCLASPAHAGEDQFFGLLTGAALGGVVGSQFGHGDGRVAATTVGVLAGGWIGNDVGRSMDNSRYNAAASGGYVAPSYGPITYRADYTPNYVGPDDAPAPDSVYGDAYNYCQEYSRLVRVGDRIQETFGTACLEPDGTWRAVDE